MRVSFEVGLTASLGCWAASPNGTLRLLMRPRMNLAHKLLAGQVAHKLLVGQVAHKRGLL